MTKEELKQWDEWWQETNEYGKTFEESQEEIRKEIDEITRKDKTGDGAPRTTATRVWQSEQEKLKNHIANYCQKSGGVITVGQLSNIIREHTKDFATTGGKAIYAGRTTLYGILAEEGYLEKTPNGYNATDKFRGVVRMLNLHNYGMRSADEDDYAHTQPALSGEFAAEFAVRVYNRCRDYYNKLT